MQASVHEAKTNLSRLLAAVERGERVIITRHGVPAAELIPARPAKVRLGRWPEMQPHVAGLATLARDDGHDVLPLTSAAALEASMMDWPHRDPFDRVIATTARHEALALISSDTAFDALRIERLWS